MFKENHECCAIQCEKCGGTMYSGAASARFVNSRNKIRSLQQQAAALCRNNAAHTADDCTLRKAEIPA